MVSAVVLFIWSLAWFVVLMLYRVLECFGRPRGGRSSAQSDKALGEGGEEEAAGRELEQPLLLVVTKNHEDIMLSEAEPSDRRRSMAAKPTAAPHALAVPFVARPAGSSSEPWPVMMLAGGWLAKRQSDVRTTGMTGVTLTEPMQPTDSSHTEWEESWMPATVPGTVLTTLVDNGIYPEPFVGDNNQAIPDIFHVGREFYTYWFLKSFRLRRPSLGQLDCQQKDRQVWLHLRGANYLIRVFLNGAELGCPQPRGCFLRRRFNITSHLPIAGGPTGGPTPTNRLAVLVEPPEHPGCVDAGGQGGDHQIACDVTPHFVEGWDWMCPIRDRNTGLWDQVWVEETGPVAAQNLHVVATPVLAEPAGSQLPMHTALAHLHVTVDLANPSGQPREALLCLRVYSPAGKCVIFEWERVQMCAKQQLASVSFGDVVIENAELWWPVGMGPHPLYTLEVSVGPVSSGSAVWHSLSHRFGVRETWSGPNSQMRSGRVFYINKRRVFVRGSNWITPDGMLRSDPELYRREVKFHAHMGLNCLRLWGGVGIATPEFLAACDEEGLMVWYEFWVTGDCMGRGATPASPVSYDGWPLDHSLFLDCARDCITWVRNHTCVILWCGGNEQCPAEDLDAGLRSMLLPGPTLHRQPRGVATAQQPAPGVLDWTRPYVKGSLWGGMASGHGDPGVVGPLSDGPYGPQEPDKFYAPDFYKYPFNPEVGSVGIPVVETMRTQLPDPTHQEPPEWKVHPDGTTEEICSPAWALHAHMNYGTGPDSRPPRNQITCYGTPATLEEYCRIAQVANFVQYQALLEGWASNMWTSYSGMLLWKSQNPWTGLRGQLYDWWGDVTGGYFGARAACEPLHVQLNRHSAALQVVNVSGADEEVKVLWEIIPGRKCGKCSSEQPRANNGDAIELTRRPQHVLSPSPSSPWQHFSWYCVSLSCWKEEVVSSSPCSSCGLVRGLWLPKTAAASQSVLEGPMLDIPWDRVRGTVAFLFLRMIGKSSNTEVSRNCYHLSRTGNDFAALSTLGQVALSLTCVRPMHRSTGDLGSVRGVVRLENACDSTVAFATRLKVLWHGKTPPKRICPAKALPAHDQRVVFVLYSDNYMTLAPKETREVDIEFHDDCPGAAYTIQAQAWNSAEVECQM